MPYPQIIKEVNGFLKKFMIIYPENESLAIFKKLFNKYRPKGNKVYDIEIASIMLANKIKKIATFNKTDFADIKEVEIIS